MKTVFITTNNNKIEVTALCDIVSYILSDVFTLSADTDSYELSVYLEKAFTDHLTFLESLDKTQSEIDSNKKLDRLARAYNRV